MVITKRFLDRRTVLRGMGAALALPLLDSMVPALSAASKTAAKPAMRLASCMCRTAFISRISIRRAPGGGISS